MKMKFGLLVAAIGMLAGCMTPYIEPQQSPDTARIKVVFEKSSKIYQLFTFESSEKCTNRFLVYFYRETPPDAKLYQPRDMEWKNIAANKVVSFSSYEDYGTKACSFTFSMTPKSGHDYMVFTELKNYSKQCKIVVLDVTSAMSVPIVKRKERSPWDETGSWCKP